MRENKALTCKFVTSVLLVRCTHRLLINFVFLSCLHCSGIASHGIDAQTKLPYTHMDIAAR